MMTLELDSRADSLNQKSVDLTIIKSSTNSFLHQIRGDQDTRGEMKDSSTEGMNHSQMTRGVPSKDSIAVAFDQTITSRRKQPLHQTLSLIPALKA